jgi:hypothetical protein
MGWAMSEYTPATLDLAIDNLYQLEGNIRPHVGALREHREAWRIDRAKLTSLREAWRIDRAQLASLRAIAVAAQVVVDAYYSALMMRPTPRLAAAVSGLRAALAQEKPEEAPDE